MRVGLFALLLVASLAHPPAAAAQVPPPAPAPAPGPTPPTPPARGPVKQLPQLITEAEAAEATHEAVLRARLTIQSDQLNLREARLDLVTRQRDLEAQPRTVARDGKLQALRAELGGVSARLARKEHELEDARAEEVVRRLAAIRADVAVADRAFEKADDAPRPGDQVGHINLANEWLQKAERLRARGEEPTAEDPEVIDPKELPSEQLREEASLFQEYAERSDERVAELEPDRVQLDRSVKHLARWRARLPNQADLPVRLTRAQQELDRLNAVLDKERERGARHRQHVQALEAELARRTREEGETPR